MSQAAPQLPDSSLRAAAAALKSARDRAADFARAFDRSIVPMVMVDNERRYVAANGGARLLFRLSLDQLRRHRIDDLTPPEMLWQLQSAWARLHADGEVSGVHDARFEDGSALKVAFLASANFLPGQHLIVFAPADWPRTELGIVAQRGDHEAVASITPREREVLTLVATGAGSDQIAARLTISTETVRSHIKNALGKLGARNRAHAVAVAARLRLIELPSQDERDGSASSGAPEDPTVTFVLTN